VLGADFVTEIVDLFVADVPPRLTRLRDAVTTRVADAIRREAHGLKGSALGVGAVRMADICEAIEHEGGAGIFEGVDARCADLEPAFNDVRNALKEMY
jgi:HPt (histidine-containing phosphotransfer) domain-containing protein